MESFFENLGFIIAAIFILAPRIIKFLVRSTLGRKLLRKLLRTVFRKLGSAARDEIERRLKEPSKEDESREEKSKEQPGSDEEFPLLEEDEDIFITRKELRVLMARADALRIRTDELHQLSLIRTEEAKKLSTEIEAILVVPIRAISRQLGGFEEHGTTPQWYERDQFQASLARYEKILRLFSSMVDARIQPGTEDILGRLDTAAMACIDPYLQHAKRMGLPYTTRLAVTILGEPDVEAAMLLKGERVAPVFVKEKLTRTPWVWMNLASDVHLDAFLSTKGLERKVVSDLGLMPQPLTLNHYGDQRALVAGLLGGMLPRLFADTAAASLVGPAMAAGLLGQHNYENDIESALRIDIGHAGAAISPPLHVRMFVALRVLGRLGFAEEATARYEEWNRQLDYPKTFVIEEPGGRRATMAIEPVLGGVVRVVDYLLTEPISPLGNLSISEIPYLPIHSERLDRIEAAVERLLRGETVAEPGYVVLAAAELAYEKSNTLESRIVSAAFESFDSKDGRFGETAIEPRAMDGAIREDFVSLEELRRAIALGAAMAPRNARLKSHRHFLRG